MTNRPFYRYGSHIELIGFKEYYGKFSARPWNTLLSRFVWAGKFVRLDYKLANVADGGAKFP